MPTRDLRVILVEPHPYPFRNFEIIWCQTNRSGDGDQTQYNYVNAGHNVLVVTVPEIDVVLPAEPGGEEAPGG